MTAITSLAGRRRIVIARGGALVLDTLLVAYAMWCADFIATRLGWWHGALARWPLLLLLAPLAACMWQATVGSLGQRGYRLHVIDDQGAPAALDRRALVAVLTAAELAVVFAPLAVSGPGVTGVTLTAGLVLILAALAMAHPRARSLPERLAGAFTSLDPVPGSGLVRPWYRAANAWLALVLFALTFAAGSIITELDADALFTGAGRTGNLWAALFSPDWSITGQVIERMVETVFLALMASSLALPLAFAIGFLGARNLMRGGPGRGLVYVMTRVVMNVVRSIEPLVWAIIFVLWVGIGPFAGMLALLVHSVAALGKLYSEAIEAIDPGPVEAIVSTGADPVQVIRHAVVPQVIPAFLSFTIYRWDINVRMATILGLVGGGGIGDLLINYQQLGAWAKVGTIIVFVTLVVWAMDLVSSKARERLV